MRIVQSRFLIVLASYILSTSFTLAYSSNVLGNDTCYITNIDTFLDQCPTLDPAINQILSDFTIKKDGVEITDFTCIEPVSLLPIAQYTNELILLQGLRTIYYMDKGRSGHLPWTSLSLYDWLKSKIGGFNISTTATYSSCCGFWSDGTRFITLRAQDVSNREHDRSWRGIAGNIALMMHEARHVDGFPHTGCCSVGGAGCDQRYDETNLSPYGIQYWLYRSWLEGYLHTGFTCLSSSRITTIKNWFRVATNNYANMRFCEDAPPELNDANNPLPPCDSSCAPKPGFLIVDSIMDIADANPGNGVCETTPGSGICTLRAAIQEANSLPGNDRIELPAGIYTLTINGVGEDYAETGDLDITDNLSLIGAGARNTIIDGGGIDRVFDIREDHGFGITVELSALTIKNGNTGFGGGIYNNQKGLVSITDSSLTNNSAGSGGGVFHSSIGLMELHRVAVSNNDATGPGGGGIYNLGSMTLINTTVSGNIASSILTNGGSAITNTGMFSLINTTISNNTVYANATGGDGSISNQGTVNLGNSIVWANSGAVCFGTGTYTSLGHNLSATDCGLTGIGDISLNPLLGPLQDYGGPTNTHGLLADSKAINSGDNTACPNTDQRGVARNDGKCDIGAFESRFHDVPADHWAFSHIETLAASGITSGCGGGNYCPNAPVTRAQMAVFLERGMRGSDYKPDPGVGNVFLDVPADYWAGGWVELLSSDGITAGCGAGNYCPENTVTREQMAVFLLRAKYGQDYASPTPTGIFNDVVLSHWSAGWIEQLANEGITGGCGSGNYCPKGSVTRDQMAVFLVKTFGL
jgi:CSLREA domain-containing protein